MVAQFSSKARAILKKQGYLIDSLSGKTIKDLKAAGKLFWPYPDTTGWEVDGLPSKLSEVAFNPHPKKFFLPSSNNKTFSEQESMLAQYSVEQKKMVPDVDVIIG